MKRAPRRVFTAEYSSEAIKLAELLGVPKAAKQLDVDTKSLYLWIRQAKTGTLKPSGAATLSAEQQRILELERELAIARLERDLLKKRRRTSRRNRGEVRRIDQQRSEHSAARLCQLMSVSCSGYQAWV